MVEEGNPPTRSKALVAAARVAVQYEELRGKVEALEEKRDAMFEDLMRCGVRPMTIAQAVVAQSNGALSMSPENVGQAARRHRARNGITRK